MGAAVADAATRPLHWIYDMKHMVGPTTLLPPSPGRADGPGQEPGVLAGEQVGGQGNYTLDKVAFLLAAHGVEELLQPRGGGGPRGAGGRQDQVRHR